MSKAKLNVCIREDQKKFLEENHVKLSSLVEEVLDEEMGKRGMVNEENPQ